MNKILFPKKTLFLLFFCSSAFAKPETGNMSEVDSLYVPTEASARVYVDFKFSSAMPGCYKNKGGYLYGDNTNNAYAALLSALKSGSKIRPFYQINEGNEGWSKCYIKAVSVY
ncbi:MAG: hypothetical protein MK185_14465 [Saccharospirillaceae bacterium]|nr:hypothetical protein [Saccharospirillaceae bacterium]